MLAPDSVVQERYRVVGRIGQGGMGAIYEALDLRLGHTVALKELLGSGEALQHAFEREARMLARLRHPALPRVSDYFSEGDSHYLVMEYIPGDDLSAILRRLGQPFAVPEVVAWADQLLEALEYLHGQQPPVIHRDIKPANIKLLPDGNVVLLDFGLSKGGIADQTLEGEWSSFYGFSPRYAPLEQIDGLGTEQRSDLYSLGATLYHLLTAREAPTAVSRAHAALDQKPDPLLPAHELNPLVPPGLSGLLTQALALHPEGRPASATVMRQALARVTGPGAAIEDATLTGPPLAMEGRTVVTPPAQGSASPAPTAGGPPRRRNVARLLGVAALLLVISAVALQSLSGRGGAEEPPAPTGTVERAEGEAPVVVVQETQTPTPEASPTMPTVTEAVEPTETLPGEPPETPTPTEEPSATPTETPDVPTATRSAPPPSPVTPRPASPTTRPASPTPRPASPTPTAEPATATWTPVPPSATPTLTPTSTVTVALVTPTPTPQVVAECDIKPGDVFFGAWQINRNLLGCPTAVEQVLSVHCEEPFQGGTMLWRGDVNHVYVVYDRDLSTEDDITQGSWTTDPTWQWDGSDPDGVGLQPPPGYVEPTRGFGWVWRTFFGGPDGPLGWALAPEQCQNSTAVVQQFELGRAYRGLSAAIYFLLGDGSFIRQ